jgi:hypothetical protein
LRPCWRGGQYMKKGVEVASLMQSLHGDVDGEAVVAL